MSRFFDHGFNEAKVSGWLACNFDDVDSGWFELINEIQMLHLVRCKLYHGFEVAEPPVRSVMVSDPRNRNSQVDGTVLREIARDCYKKMLGEADGH